MLAPERRRKFSFAEKWQSFGTNCLFRSEAHGCVKTSHSRNASPSSGNGETFGFTAWPSPSKANSSETTASAPRASTSAIHSVAKRHSRQLARNFTIKLFITPSMAVSFASIAFARASRNESTVLHENRSNPLRLPSLVQVSGTRRDSRSGISIICVSRITVTNCNSDF